MPMRRGQGRWSKMLRRGTALFLTTVTVWVLSLTADMGAAAQTFQTLAESPAFVSAALRAELGNLPLEDDPMNGLEGWQRLILRQSPALMAFEGGPDLSGEQPEQEPGATQAPSMEPDDPEDPHQLPEVTTAPEDIVGKTLLPVSADGYDAAQGEYIENRPGLPLDVAEIAQVLTEMGLSVIHDTELYDYPEYNGSYDRSLAAVETYLERYPTIKVVMDVHRDALIGEDGTIYKPITTINSEKCAQVMLVMGSDAKYTHPNWRQNLSLAVKIQKEMNTLWPTLARPIGLRENRYNQQLTTGSLLVEVGSHGNTLQEALAAARMFARAAGAVLLEQE